MVLGLKTNVKMGHNSLRLFSDGYRNIYLFFIVAILFFSILNISAIAKNTVQPVIDYFDAHPHVQLKTDYVNITCIAKDNEEIQTVNVTIFYPGGESKIESMLWSPKGKYVYNSIYNVSGNYSFYVEVEDEAGNVANTSVKNFWITSNKNDKDSDGMPDSWEEKYNLCPEDSDDADIDSDLDGYTNQKEYQIGTNPLKDIFLQNAAYQVRDNSKYLALSVFLFSLLVLFSFYGMRGRLL